MYLYNVYMLMKGEININHKVVIKNKRKYRKSLII